MPKARNKVKITAKLLKKGIYMLGNDEIGNKKKQQVFAESVPYFLMLLTTIITIISGLRYIYTNYHVLLPPYYLRGPSREPDG